MNSICIIPARGGSKRIPRKNIKPFLGKPIIAYSIEAALKSGIFNEVMVSTDDEEIAAVAKQHGASVPFLRSAETAGDYATTVDVLLEVISRYKERGLSFDIVCCLYSTAPFVTPDRIKDAASLITDDVDACFTMVQYSYPVQRSLRIDKNGFVAMTFPEHLTKRTQDLEKIYHDAGQFYFVKTNALVNEKTVWCKRTKPLVLSELEVQDLDTITDWQLAEMKYQLLNK